MARTDVSTIVVMMTERRYREDEVRRIFGLATRQGGNEPVPVADPQGITLADMQSIGREVGLEPDAVARAAAALDAKGSAAPRGKSLGMPIEVGHTVQLSRALTDTEWEQLVAELRSTFRARGKVATLGTSREWSNGNLHACVEPTESGYRLRMGTRKGDAAGLNALGATGVAAGAVVFASLALSGGLQTGFFAPWLISAAGVGAIVANFVRLPRWASQREEQMEHIAARIKSIVKPQSEDNA